jgi:hypothetical protein
MWVGVHGYCPANDGKVIYTGALSLKTALKPAKLDISGKPQARIDTPNVQTGTEKPHF